MTPTALPSNPTADAAADDGRYLALQARDARFDGHFFTGVTSTGIYCRPVCAVRTPRRENCRFFALAAQAESAGFRPCLRCRPELAPQSAPWTLQDAGAILQFAGDRGYGQRIGHDATEQAILNHIFTDPAWTPAGTLYLGFSSTTPTDAGGNFTEHVFTAMKERDLLRINGPYGSFFLREESAKPMLLVAGGTGFAPIKAIVEHAIAENCQRPMFIYWGAKARIDLYQNALPEAWAAQHANIRYVPVLSAPAAGDAWTGRTGFVHQAVLADFADLSGHQVYACGSPAMIDSAKRDFMAQGLPEEEFFADAFSFASN